MPTVAFDVIGTLFTLERPTRRLAELGAPEHSLDLWFAQTLRDAVSLSHSGGYRPLAEVLEAALQRLAAAIGLEAGEEELRGGWRPSGSSIPGPRPGRPAGCSPRRDGRSSR